MGLCIGVFLGYYSRYGVDQVYLRSILSVAHLCEMSCKRYFQLGDILPSLINLNVDDS